MSAPEHAKQPVRAQEPRLGIAAPRTPEPQAEPPGWSEAPEAIRALVWPRRPIASVGFTLLVAAGVALPLVQATTASLLLPVALTAALAIGYVARLVFEALCPAPTAAWPRRVAAAALAATGAAALGLAVAAILSLATTPAANGAGAAIVLGAMLGAAWTRALEQRLGTANRRIVLVGTAPQHRDLAREIDRRGDLHLAGHVSLARAGNETLEGVVEALERLRPTTIVLSGQAVRDERMVAAAAKLHAGGVRVRSLHELYEQEFRKVAASELSPAWFLFDVAGVHDHRFYGVAKRILETTAAAFLLLLTAPIMPLIALAVRCGDRGPVLFRQVRVGRDGELIGLVKFRTMCQAPAGDVGWATDHAHRITPVGRWLRRFRLDELPQLFNVVRGDLALVGPRPEQPAIAERLGGELQFYNARHSVRPGLTGWAQVNHGYGGNDADVVEKLQYEFFYIKHQSLLLDLRIIVATARAMVSGGGV